MPKKLNLTPEQWVERKREYRRKYYKKHSEKILEQIGQWRDKNPEAWKVYNENKKTKLSGSTYDPAYYQAHKDIYKKATYKYIAKPEIREKQRKYSKEKVKEYYENNKEKIRERQRRYKENLTDEQKERYKQKRKEHYHKNRELYCERARQFFIDHPEKAKEYYENYKKSGKKDLYYEKNMEKLQAYGRQYYKDHQEFWRERNKLTAKEKKLKRWKGNLPELEREIIEGKEKLKTIKK